MPIGYVTANQGESRYTVAIPRKTPLLAALIEARRVEIEGIDRVLEELRKHESDRRAVYDAAMEDVHLATLMYAECRESYTEPQCRADKIAAANSAYSDARNACDDTWRDCRFACDIGDGDCSGACDDARDACELVAETARDRALAAVDRLCVDEVVAHLQACQAQWSPVIASAQAAAVEALAPLQDAMIAITWERTKRTAAVRRLNELEAIEAGAEMATCWSAQYNEEIPVGELPDEPTGTEENAVTVATVSGRAIITDIVSVNPCAHDARAMPADVLFVDAALAPGAETWRPTWRTGTVTAVNPDGTLKARINPAILPGTLGTRVSRRNIECTPPGAFFDEDGELDARLGIARQAYDDALQDLADVRAEIQACKDGYTVQECTAPRNEVCEYNREQSMMACIDNRDYCLSIAQDANGEQYCLDQFDACEQQVDAIFSACVDGVLADCIEAKRQHDNRCERDRQFDLSQAETAVSSAQRNLINATADIQGPPAELIRDLPIAHCTALRYKVGDDVLIDFPARATSTGLDWATATSGQIRSAAMAVWQSARVVGWASSPRKCTRMSRAFHFEYDIDAQSATLVVVEQVIGGDENSEAYEISRTPVPCNPRWFTLSGNVVAGEHGSRLRAYPFAPAFGVPWTNDGATCFFFENYITGSLGSETPFGGRAWSATLPPVPYEGEDLVTAVLSVIAEPQITYSKEHTRVVIIKGEYWPLHGYDTREPEGYTTLYATSLVGEILVGMTVEDGVPQTLTMPVDYQYSRSRSVTQGIEYRTNPTREWYFATISGTTETANRSINGVQILDYDYNARRDMHYVRAWNYVPGHGMVMTDGGTWSRGFRDTPHQINLVTMPDGVEWVPYISSWGTFIFRQMHVDRWKADGVANKTIYGVFWNGGDSGYAGAGASWWLEPYNTNPAVAAVVLQGAMAADESGNPVFNRHTNFRRLPSDQGVNTWWTEPDPDLS